jgi:hypothetical protein
LDKLVYLWAGRTGAKRWGDMDIKKVSNEIIDFVEHGEIEFFKAELLESLQQEDEFIKGHILKILEDSDRGAVTIHFNFP